MSDFLNRVSQGVTRGVTAASTSSKGMLEKAKINSAIGVLEKEKLQLATDLGLKLYSLHKAGQQLAPAELERVMQDMSSREEQIAQQQELIRRIDTEIAAANAAVTAADATAAPPVGTVLLKCGHYNKPEVRFCASCGAAAEQVVAPEPAVVRSGATCSCGASLNEGARFCASCGATVAKVEAPEPAVEQPVANCTCGASLKEGARFCASCGAATEQTATATPE